nr:hypothetical protein Iba_chr14eCG5180 [Ipomoea batatas]
MIFFVSSSGGLEFPISGESWDVPLTVTAAYPPSSSATGFTVPRWSSCSSGAGAGAKELLSAFPGFLKRALTESSSVDSEILLTQAAMSVRMDATARTGMIEKRWVWIAGDGCVMVLRVDESSLKALVDSEHIAMHGSLIDFTNSIGPKISANSNQFDSLAGLPETVDSEQARKKQGKSSKNRNQGSKGMATSPHVPVQSPTNHRNTPSNVTSDRAAPPQHTRGRKAAHGTSRGGGRGRDRGGLTSPNDHLTKEKPPFLHGLNSVFQFGSTSGHSSNPGGPNPSQRGSGNSSRPADRAHLFCCRTVEGYLSSRDRVDIFHASSRGSEHTIEAATERTSQSASEP